MPVWRLRKFTGLVLQTFAFTALVLNGYVFPLIFRERYAKSLEGPDASQGLIYACYPKNVPGYYDEQTIVRSWYFLLFILLIMVGGVLQFRLPKTTHSEVNAPNAIALFVGMLTAFVFLFVAEESLVQWLIAQGAAQDGRVGF